MDRSWQLTSSGLPEARAPKRTPFAISEPIRRPRPTDYARSWSAEPIASRVASRRLTDHRPAGRDATPPLGNGKITSARPYAHSADSLDPARRTRHVRMRDVLKAACAGSPGVLASAPDRDKRSAKPRRPRRRPGLDPAVTQKAFRAPTTPPVCRQTILSQHPPDQPPITGWTASRTRVEKLRRISPVPCRSGVFDAVLFGYGPVSTSEHKPRSAWIVPVRRRAGGGLSALTAALPSPAPRAGRARRRWPAWPRS